MTINSADAAARAFTLPSSYRLPTPRDGIRELLAEIFEGEGEVEKAINQRRRMLLDSLAELEAAEGARRRLKARLSAHSDSVTDDDVTAMMQERDRLVGQALRCAMGLREWAEVDGPCPLCKHDQGKG